MPIIPRRTSKCKLHFANRLCLCPHREVFLGNELHVVEDDGLTGKSGVVGAENENSLPAEQETVEIGQAYAGIAQNLYGIGGTAGLVVEFDGENVGEGYGDAGLFQPLVCPEGLCAYHTVDAVLCGVGNGRSDNLQAKLTEETKNLDQGT